MKTLRLLALSLTVLFALLVPRPAEARAEVSFDFFYDSLSPYGEWLRVADYGYCWRPTEVDRDWSPYSDGYWAYTDAGWTWVSYEDYGGIVYHYGRWVRVEDEGWCWVPDYEWGPAWVSWRNNDDYVGWAPLPPEARWQPAVGISVWVDRDCDIGPDYYSFCRVGDFGAPFLRGVIINRYENITIIRRTVNCTNITYNTHYGYGPVIFCGGPRYDYINERVHRRIPAMKLVVNVDVDMHGFRDLPRGDRRRNFNGRTVGNQLVVTAPVVRPPSDPDFLKTKVKKVVSVDKVSRGWSGVKNDDVRRELKQEMDRQTKGLTRDTAPAKAVAVNDLKFVPEKGDPNAVLKDAKSDRKDRGNDNVTGTAQTPDMGKKPGKEKDAVIAQEKDKDKEKRPGRDAADAQVPNGGNLKPFNPTATTDDNQSRKDKPQVGVDDQRPQGEAMRKEKDKDRDQDLQRQQRDAAEQARKVEDAQRKQADAMRKQQEDEQIRRNNQDAQRKQAPCASNSKKPSKSAVIRTRNASKPKPSSSSVTLRSRCAVIRMRSASSATPRNRCVVTRIPSVSRPKS